MRTLSVLSTLPLCGLLLILLHSAILSKASVIQCPRIPASIVSETLHENGQQTRRLMQRIRLWQVGREPTPEPGKQSPNNSLTLLSIGKDVVKAACPSLFVSPQLLDNALNAFLILHGINGERYFGDPVTPPRLQRISEVLYFCQQSLLRQSSDLIFESDDPQEECSSPLMSQVCYEALRGSDESKSKSACKKLKPRTGRMCPQYNLIIEVVWNIVDLVQAACMSEFRNMNAIGMYHFWEQAQELLFTRRIKSYWYRSKLPIEIYQAVLHPDVLPQLYNLELCVEAMYSTRSTYPHRLLRPSFPHDIYG